MEQLIVMLVFAALVGLALGFVVGEKKGKSRGRELGQAVGASAANAEWMARAQAAKDAGTPWAGVDYP